MKIFRLSGSIAFAIFALLASPGIFAQGGGGNTGGGGSPGGGTTGGGGFNSGGTTGGSSTFNTGSTSQTTGGSSSGGGGGGSTNNSQPLNLDNQLNIAPTTPPPVDERNQGFIGPNGQQIIDQGFVGASTQLSGGQPTSGNSFGGGVNTQGGGGAGGRGGGGALGAQGLRSTGGAMGRNTGLGGFGNTNTAGVRRSVRNRLVNQVQVNRTPSAEVARRFSSRIDRIPTIAGLSDSVQISLVNGTATLTGNVPTAEAANKLERQLRLEPGVYKIDNRLQVGQ